MKWVVWMMHQPVESTAYCLNCANEWPAMLASEELSLVCPECRWRLAVPVELVLSGWWTTREHDEDASSIEAERHKEQRREQARFARDVRKDLQRLPVIDPRHQARREDRGGQGDEAERRSF